MLKHILNIYYINSCFNIDKKILHKIFLSSHGAWQTHKCLRFCLSPIFLFSSPIPLNLRVILLSQIWGMANGFRCNCRSFFLTYPRCDSSRQELLEFLCGLEPSWVYVTVGEETHADGSPHLHALVVTAKKRDIRDAAHFNFNGHHCNVQPARNVSDVAAYVQKENCFVEIGNRPKRKGIDWSSIVSCSNAAEALATVKENFPREYVLNLERIEYFLSKHYAVIKPLL